MLINQKISLNEASIEDLKSGLIEVMKNKKHFISIPFIPKIFINALIIQVSKLKFRKARPLVGNSVTQDFEVCFPAPREEAIDTLARSIEKLFTETLKLMNNPPILEPTFNDIAIQRYLPNSVGISPHKDHKKYSSVIIIVTLSGSSNFCLCDDRNGSNSYILNDKPGNIVILPATGFKMLNIDYERPLHFVNKITTGRLSIGLRQNSEII